MCYEEDSFVRGERDRNRERFICNCGEVRGERDDHHCGHRHDHDRGDVRGSRDREFVCECREVRSRREPDFVCECRRLRGRR